jgi:hypothetical protein
MTNVLRLYDKSKDANHWSGGDVLRHAQEEWDSKRIDQDCKLLVLTMSKDGKVRFAQNGLNHQTIISMLEIAKFHFLSELCEEN